MKKDSCVLLIHGFGGGEDELQSLKSALEENGIDVSMVKLSGHTGRYMDFWKSTREQWVNSAKRAAEELLEDYESLSIVGFSMGGLIATYLFDYPIKSIVFANTPLIFCDISRIIKNFEHEFWKYTKKYTMATIKTPPTALKELVSLLNETKDNNFPKIKCKSLILQTKDDDTANYKSAAMLSERLGGTSKAVIYEQGGHKIFEGKVKKQACMEVLRFIKSAD